MVNVLPPMPPLSDVIEEDDGFRHYQQMTREERKPKFVKNKLAKPNRSFTGEERNQVNAALSPENMPGDWPHS